MKQCSWSIAALVALIWSPSPSESFHVVPPTQQRRSTSAPDAVTRGIVVVGTTQRRQRTTTTSTTTTTQLHALVNVPMGFFTTSFIGMGLTLAVAKKFARIRMEENAWEQRLAEARQERMRRDPTLTELDLRRQEAAMEWSAYGKPRQQEEEARRQRQAEQQRRRDEYDEDEYTQRGSRRRVKVMDREEEEEEDYDHMHRMSDKEIQEFEIEFGVDYDPYYDDPYTLEELPEGEYKEDKVYGDRYYSNGETFFKDKESGLYYRQGAKPRNISFWS